MISVLMGVRCSNDRIGDVENAVRSILNQTYIDFEFLICDNGSDEKVKSLLDKYSKIDKRIHIIRSENIDTLQKKLNLCLSISRGELIARMDDDDFSHPNRFKEQLDFLNKHSNISFVGCNIMQVIKKELIGIRYLPVFPKISDFKFTQPYIHPTLMFRREVLLSVGGYSESKWQESCEDYDLLLKLYERGYSGANIQEVLLDYSIANSIYKKNPYCYRINEAVTRYKHFRILKRVPVWWPYIIKPLVVGLIPLSILNRIKLLRWRK